MTAFNESDSYLSHLRAEHYRLDQLTRSIRDDLSDASEDDWNRVTRPHLAAKLGALKDELSRHIGEEEHGGCIDEAISRLPSLAKEAEQLAQESDELRKSLWQVMHFVDAGTQADAQRSFRAFAGKLIVHERHETQVAEKGMNRFPFGEQ